MIVLRGMAWDHDRGAGPLLATSAAFCAARPEVDVRWDVRSLEDFAHFPIERLAENYDLIAVDHPSVGFAASIGCLAPFDELIGPDVLAEHAADSVGGSHRSYRFAGRQWALAVDAACHVAAGRPDLFPTEAWPSSWDEAIRVAERLRASGGPRVALPLVPTDVYCLYMTVLASLGAPAFGSDERLADRPVAEEAMRLMRALATASYPAGWDCSPITLLELASTTDDIAYVPALFGYSNYARLGYRTHRIAFGPLPADSGAVLGGVGLAVSARSTNLEEAAAYVRFVADTTVQRTIVTAAGGQPASRAAWDDPAADMLAGGFLRATRAVIDAAWVRPRFNGMIRLTPLLGRLLREAIRGERSVADALDACDTLYVQMLAGQPVREPDEPEGGWYASAGMP